MRINSNIKLTIYYAWCGSKKHCIYFYVKLPNDLKGR
jgi:hypothetical protein